MVFQKKVELKDATAKYGFATKGMFAAEAIRKGEPIFQCNTDLCDYIPMDEQRTRAKTRDETLAILKANAHLADFIMHYQYMVDDDLFDWPRGYETQTLYEDCMYFNHSCDPNAGFGNLDESLVIAIRDIAVGDEITYDYQFMDVAPSFYENIHCRCGADICRGVLKFSMYRDVDWQTRFYKYCGAFVKRKIDELSTKWYSSQCHLKFYASGASADKELGLTTLVKIRKGDMVAKYSSTPIRRQDHYIRHSEQPTCFLDGDEVYTNQDVEANTELTLKF